jgi:hypothetical protein
MAVVAAFYRWVRAFAIGTLILMASGLLPDRLAHASDDEPGSQAASAATAPESAEQRGQPLSVETEVGLRIEIEALRSELARLRKARDSYKTTAPAVSDTANAFDTQVANYRDQGDALRRLKERASTAKEPPPPWLPPDVAPKGKKEDAAQPASTDAGAGPKVEDCSALEREVERLRVDAPVDLFVDYGLRDGEWSSMTPWSRPRRSSSHPPSTK